MSLVKSPLLLSAHILYGCTTSIHITGIPILRYADSLFWSQSFMYLLVFPSWWIAWHIPFLKLLSTISNIPISVSSSNSTFVFFTAACHPISCAERMTQFNYIYFKTYLESSEIHQSANICCPKHINHGNRVCFNFEVFSQSFHMPEVCTSNIFHIEAVKSGNIYSNFSQWSIDSYE